LQQAKPAASLAVQSISKAPWIEDAGVPLWRKLAASALVGLAFLFGAAVLVIYATLSGRIHRIFPTVRRRTN
jgi:hypothetical protein